MSGPGVRVRFAPSPTGLLHVGNARTALFNWLFARQHKGVYILRIEDTDAERSRPEYEEKLKQDLKWLGLDWDEGPDVAGDFGPYRQSQRLDRYADFTARLLADEKAYYCFCTPDELASEREAARKAGRDPRYSGKCRDISPAQARSRAESGRAAAVRLRVPGTGEVVFKDLVRGRLSFDLALIGDPVLVRPNGVPAYNYAVVIDDHLMRISHVIRGEDHTANTVRQILTFRALGLTPPLYAHLSMVMGEDNTRLSKRHGATSVDQFNRDGVLPQALFNYLALLGWAPPEGREVLSSAELQELFDLRKVSRSAAIFDYSKLHWLNRRHMLQLPVRENAERAAPLLQAAGFMPADMTAAHWDWLEQAVLLLLERVDRYADLPQVFSLLFDFPLADMGQEEQDILRSECGGKVIHFLHDRMAALKEFSYQLLAEMSGEIKAATGCKGKELFHPLRVALTARTSGLDLDKLIPLVESGSRLALPRPLLSCRERVRRALQELSRPLNP